MDEPTNGLDPKGIKDLRELIISLAKQGTAVFVSGHILSELEVICGRAAIIKKGEIVKTFSLSEMSEMQSMGGKTKTLEEIFMEYSGGDGEEDNV